MNSLLSAHYAAANKASESKTDDDAGALVWTDEYRPSFGYLVGSTAPATKGRYHLSRPMQMAGAFFGPKSGESYSLTYEPDFPQLRSGRTTDVPLARNLPVTEASVVKAKAIALAHHKAGKDR